MRIFATVLQLNFGAFVPHAHGKVPFTRTKFFVNVLVNHSSVLLRPCYMSRGEVHSRNDCIFWLEHWKYNSSFPAGVAIFPNFSFDALHKDRVSFQKHVLAIVVLLLSTESKHRGLEVGGIHFDIMHVFTALHLFKWWVTTDRPDHHVILLCHHSSVDQRKTILHHQS